MPLRDGRRLVMTRYTTPEQRAKMLQLRKLGWSVKQVARLMNFSTKTVSDHTKQQDRRSLPYYETAEKARELLKEGRLRPVEIARVCDISQARVCAIRRRMRDAVDHPERHSRVSRYRLSDPVEVLPSRRGEDH
jgi:predicted transcriptional regulator